MGNPATSQRIDEWLQRRVRAFASRRDSGPDHVHGLRLGDDPPVILLWDYEFQRTLKSRPDFWATLQGRPSLVVLLRSWDIRNRSSLGDWPVLLSEYRSAHPDQRVIYAANVEDELSVLGAAGIETLWFNANALVDERVFALHADAAAGADREFDAIYDARFSRFKRHHLAAEVRRLALVHYASPHLVEPLWRAAMKWRLRHANVLNREYFGYWPVPLGPAEIARANTRARVGLCLSEVEGAMLASIQYLLCGLPVVTTPSRGGRDVFFDAQNSVVVTPEPKAVAAGVRELITRKIDPSVIRGRTIERMAEHRQRLIACVEDFQAAHGVPSGRRLGTEWASRQRGSSGERLA